MKKTSTLFLLLLLTVMGAQAATKTIYCKCAQAWWKEAGAAVAVHYWGSATSGTSWPGERMTPVPGETDLWTADVPDDLTGIMFVRVNGAGAVSDWGAKTADLTLPADEKNMYTITSESPVWGDPGAAGAWGIYTPPTVRHFYVAGNGTAGNAWCDGKSWDVAGSEIVDGSVTFSNVPAGDYQFKLTAGAWETNWGFDALSRDCPTWLVCSSDANNNICFTNPSTQDITITFDGTSICLVANLPVHYYVAGNGTAGNAWCDGKSGDVAGSEIVDGSVTFYDAPAGEDEVRV
ncbi:MAG: hypothetical protein MJZ89_04210, partial [Paludibacteraceae bacterium]|nr:hypothetical protein [Paludibacteraceae bacterium]